MLEIQKIRDHKDICIEGLKKRNFPNPEEQLEQIINLDDLRKQLQKELDNILADINSISKEIGELFKQKKLSEVDNMKATVAEKKEASKSVEERHREVLAAMEELLYATPNIPHAAVVAGKTAEENEIYKDWTGGFPELPPGAMTHWELADKYGIFDLKLGVKLTGAGFPVYKGKGARLQRALINFFLDESTKAGYEEYQPPILVNEESARGTGQLPDKEAQMYHVGLDNLYLIPTAEVPVTNIYRDIILKESDFPVKMSAYTPCFRREAGSYGADVKGLNRLHQFDKVEIVQLAHPKNSYGQLQEMLAHVEGLLKKLELPYRILRLCGGDTGFASAMTYDFEVFSVAQKRWLEVSSVSNFETFQSNRLKLRYKDESGKSVLAHTLNGSALALPRILASMLEYHQTENGINIPKVLQNYTGFKIIN